MSVWQQESGKRTTACERPSTAAWFWVRRRPGGRRHRRAGGAGRPGRTGAHHGHIQPAGGRWGLQHRGRRPVHPEAQKDLGAPGRHRRVRHRRPFPLIFRIYKPASCCL